MNDLVSVPKWVFGAVVGPLTLIALINGVGTYYGQKSLYEAVANLNKTVAQLPRKTDVQAKYDFAAYRIDRLEAQTARNTAAIEANRAAIAQRSADKDALWQVPGRSRPVTRPALWRLHIPL